MTETGSRYSERLAQRIRCLQIGSFDCLIRGDVFDEEEAAVVLQYLDVPSYRNGYYLAAVRAYLYAGDPASIHGDEGTPAGLATKVFQRLLRGRGYARCEHDGAIALMCVCRFPGTANELLPLLESASDELESRHGISLRFGYAPRCRRLTEAQEAFRVAEAALNAESATETKPSGGTGRNPDFRNEPQILFQMENSAGELPCDYRPVQEIQEFILARYSDPGLSLCAIAETFDLTETYVSQLFKARTGMNYSTFLEQVRVNEAQRLLIQSDMAVNEVALAVGYQTNSTFYRAFRRATDTSPTAFRNRRGRSSGRPRFRRAHSAGYSRSNGARAAHQWEETGHA